MHSGRPGLRLAPGAPWSAVIVLTVSLAAAACGGAGESESETAPRPLGEVTDLPDAAVAPPQEQARAIATNPRLLLFDLQTALESVREARGSYPTVQEFGATEAWALQREALGEAFDTWSYESDGGTYRLTGYSADRELAIESPR